MGLLECSFFNDEAIRANIGQSSIRVE